MVSKTPLEQDVASLIERINALENAFENQVSLTDELIAEKDEEIAEKEYIIQKLVQLLYGQKRDRFEQPNDQLDLFALVPESV